MSLTSYFPLKQGLDIRDFDVHKISEGRKHFIKDRVPTIQIIMYSRWLLQMRCFMEESPNYYIMK